MFFSHIVEDFFTEILSLRIIFGNDKKYKKQIWTKKYVPDLCKCLSSCQEPLSKISSFQIKNSQMIEITFVLKKDREET